MYNWLGVRVIVRYGTSVETKKQTQEVKQYNTLSFVEQLLMQCSWLLL